MSSSNLHSEKALDVYGSFTELGFSLIQFARHGNAHQRWWARLIAEQST